MKTGELICCMMKPGRFILIFFVLIFQADFQIFPQGFRNTDDEFVKSYIKQNKNLNAPDKDYNDATFLHFCSLSGLKKR